MSLPGLGFHGGGRVVGISSSANTTFVLADALSNPAFAIRYVLILQAGVERGSASISLPSIDASTGMNPGSIGKWIVSGSARGRGGAGAQGNVSQWRIEGGGGGGAGFPGGAGGVATPPATDGNAGTATTGGTGGASAAGSIIPNTNYESTAGGDAVWLNHAVTAVLVGDIHGGGGGGGSGFYFTDGVTIIDYVSGKGGDLDEYGYDNGTAIPLTPPGNAVRLIGGSASFSSSGPGTVGTVGA